MKFFLTPVLIIIGFAGCSPKVTVTPMDRAFLNDYLMRADRDTLALKMFDHAYYSREGSEVDESGGGCGCN